MAKVGPKVKVPIIKDMNENWLLTEEECHGRWREYFQSLLNLNPTLRNPASHWQPQLKWGPDDVATVAPVTLGEVHATLKGMRSGKAPGICSISVEQLELRNSVVQEWLVGLLNGILEKQEVPPDWYKGIILPLWTRQGRHQHCGSNRGITHLSAMRKVFL